jgi:type IX secretion system PorP/SprF family membrane protein
MTNMKKSSLIILFISAVGSIWGQLFPQYSQYMFNPLTINPAATGAEDALAGFLSHRSMWTGIEGAPQLQHAGIHSPCKNDKIALGVTFARDQIAVSTAASFGGSFAYRVPLKKGKLSFGLSASAISFGNKWSEVITTESNDNSFAEGDMVSWLVNFSGGIYYYSDKGYIGISVPQFLHPEYRGGGDYGSRHDISSYNYHFTAGREFALSSQFNVLPSTLIRYASSSPVQVDASLLFRYENYLELGFSYRVEDAYVLLARAYVKPQISIAYSYDRFTGILGQYDRGTHELSLLYAFKYNSQSPSPKLF